MSKKGVKGGYAASDFFVVGSSTVDIIARTSDVERVDIAGKSIERLVCISFATKSELEQLEIHPGGSASNSAIMIRTLGSSVNLLSAVGSDSFGKIILDDLKKNGINASNVKVFKNAATGVGIVILSGGEKSILVFRGANSELGGKDFSDAAVKGVKRVFIASLVSQKNYALFKKAVAAAKKYGKPVVFAPSITMLHSWLPQLRQLRPHFDVMIVNYEEGSYYAGRKSVKEILSSLPARIAVVMKDVEGAYARDERKFFHVSAVPVKIADTTGAGDAFSGAFAQAYYSTGSVAESMRTAAAAAALKLTHKGAHFGKTKAELAAFMKKHRSSLVVRRF